MRAALSRSIDEDRPPPEGEADAVRARLAPVRRDRRGPLRPERLMAPRARLGGGETLKLITAGDAAVLAALGFACLEVSTPGGLMEAPIGRALPYVVHALFALTLFREFGLYRFRRTERASVHAAKVTLSCLAAAAGALGVQRMAGGGGADAVALLIFAGLALMSLHSLHLFWWMTVRRWRRQGRLTPNVVVVGATRHAERLIAAALERGDMHVIGVFDDRLARAPDQVVGVPVLGDVAALLQHRVLPFVDRVVIAVDPAARTRVREIIDRLRRLPNEVSLLVDLESVAQRDAALARIADMPLARLSGPPSDGSRALAKRMQDLVIGSLAAIALAPVMLAIALLVRLDSRGPALFRQVRHGFNNEPITVWKFRTMRVEAADPTAQKQVVADDPRVTRLGRFLRRTSLDELPQLLNVLKGEMSLVGPRPHAIGMKTGEVESERLVAEYAWRHRIKPGMTGYAAICGSRGPLHDPTEVRRRVALDIAYVDRQSLWFDLWIMVMTLPCLLGDARAVR